MQGALTESTGMMMIAATYKTGMHGSIIMAAAAAAVLTLVLGEAQRVEGLTKGGGGTSLKLTLGNGR